MTRKHANLLAMLLALVALVGCRSAHVTSAILYIDQQMYQRAVDVLHEGLEYSPNEAEAYFYLGESHTKLAEEAVNDNEYLEARRQYEMAYEYYSRSLELDELLKERVDESLLYSYILRGNDAKAELENARNAQGDLRTAYYEAAEGHFRLAYASYPDSTSPVKNVARMKILQSMDEQDAERRERLLGDSLELLDQVLAENPEAYGLLSDKANVLNKLGRNDEAGAIYDQLLAEHPDDTGLLIDIAALAQEEEQYERAADLFVRVAAIYESDDDADNDEDLYALYLQSATFYSDPSVLNYPAALENYDKALDLEDVPEENTLLQKLKLHFDYGTQLQNEAGATAPEQLPEAAREQFRSGVNTAMAMVDQLMDNPFAYYYKGLCHFALGERADGEAAMRQYEQLSQ